MTGLTKQEIASIKKSYLNLLGFFLTEEKIESRYLRCLLKWGFELGVSPDDLRDANIDISDLRYSEPGDKIERVESIYHLVHMICLDHVVEDIELEVASIYAEKLGFERALVSDLLKSIVTADSDGTPPGSVRQQVIDFLRLT